MVLFYKSDDSSNSKYKWSRSQNATRIYVHIMYVDCRMSGFEQRGGVGFEVSKPFGFKNIQIILIT
jgi:hypothetical protein